MRRRRRDSTYDDTSGVYQLSTGPLRRRGAKKTFDDGSDGSRKGTVSCLSLTFTATQTLTQFEKKEENKGMK